MSDQLTQQELENYLWGAATLLRGVIDPGEYKNIIFPLMFFKRISDVYDEEYEQALNDSGGDEEYASFAENHRFNVPKGAHWDDVREVTTDIGLAIREAMRAIEKENPDTLFGIFGDTNWTNKNRLTDRILTDLLEHFSSVKLTVENVPQDEFGTAYEYLIKKFADDSGHTAAEFYTNRTVVELMTLIMNPQSGESIYDPTCGSGGMLLNAVLHVKEQGDEWRNIKVYGQEINLITSAIARMNMFIHGIEDFQIERGDTLSNPAFVENDQVQQFNICLANPPYSIKRWDQESWKNDPWGRNIYGTPPQGNADYAFFQHIIASLKEDTGRCAILWPHGVLFRDSEKDMRSKLIENDYIDTVLGMGPNLFYNSPMDSCIVICNKNKPPERQGKILFIRADDQIENEKTQSFLSEEHIKNIFAWYKGFKEIPGRTTIATLNEIENNNYVITVARYVHAHLADENQKEKKSVHEVISKWKSSSKNVHESFAKTKDTLYEVIK